MFSTSCLYISFPIALVHIQAASKMPLSKISLGSKFTSDSNLCLISLAALSLDCIVAGIFYINVFPGPINKKHSLDYKWPLWWIVFQYLRKLIFNYLCFSTKPFDYCWLALETCRSTHAIGLSRKATGSVHCFVQKLAGSRRNCFMLDRFCL